MSSRIVIAGSGFAGTWAAISAARAVALAEAGDRVEITVISPAPNLHIRPRLYEAGLDGMEPDVAPLFAAIGVRHVAGTVETIDADRHEVEIARVDGVRTTVGYDRLVVATGSRLFRPDIPGLRDHAFDVDQIDSARTLDAHLRSLAAAPASVGRDTVVVAGAGFTGIETATEMPARLQAILGPQARARVVLLEQAPVVGPDLGPGPRPVIEEALAECGVEVITGEGVAAVDAKGATTTTGRRIEADTVVWTAGMRASPLAAQIAGERDRLGRVHADGELHAKGARDIFVTGDVALAATDGDGHVASMSCQHALSLGRVAGHNAAAELVGLPLHRYRQPKYVTCLDLGPWGAIFTEGWDRQVRLTRGEGKAMKRMINTQWIYPPAADREAAFATASPDHVIVA